MKTNARPAARAGCESGFSAGFSTIELLISSAVLLVAIAAVSTQYISQVRMEKGLHQNLQSKTIMDSVISTVSASPQSFPPLKNGANFPVYVACLDNNGTVLNDYSAMVLGSPSQPAPTVAGGNCASNNTAGCLCGWSGVEAHLNYSGGLYLLDAHVIRYSKSADGTAKQTLETRQILVNPQLSAPVKSVPDPCTLGWPFPVC